MKFQFKNIVAAVAITLAFTSCSNDEETPIQDVSGTGNLTLEFDNVYNGANFAFNTPYSNTNGEIVSVSKIKYIVSNIVLTREDGSTFTYPKYQSYFIVDESITASQDIVLTNVPSGNYTSVKFGIGVDKEQWQLGATGQGEFLALAQTAEMMWSWTSGYKFVNFEGTFTTPTNTTASDFKVHTGKTMVSGVENYNYTDISIGFPNKALVRQTQAPDVHLLVDLSKIIDGTNKISLANAPSGNIMGGANLGLVTANLNNMFVVDHIHND